LSNKKSGAHQFWLSGRPGVNILCEWHLAKTFRGAEAVSTWLFSQNENCCRGHWIGVTSTDGFVASLHGEHVVISLHAWGFGRKPDIFPKNSIFLLTQMLW